jgi:lipopolysaccharide export system permease protein
MRKGLSRKAIQYIFFEMMPSFLLGLLVFIFILLMFQTLRYTEFVLIHGGDLKTIGEIIFYLSISFIPALFPMSLLFAVLMTYGRLSSDSELVALKASGVGPISLLIPALILGAMVSVLSAQTMFGIAPWGNRNFEILISKQSSQKAGLTLREGTFSEGFFDMVIYANKVNSEAGTLEKVFIYDERQGGLPLTIISKNGQIVQDPNNPGNSALLRLREGDIHRKGENHTQIHFQTFDFKLSDPAKVEMREKSPQSLQFQELNDRIKAPETSPEDRIRFLSEFHKRWAVSSACFIFALLGVGLGSVANRRTGKGSGLVPSLIVIVLYWILYLSAEGLARSGQAPVVIAIWTPNLIFLIFALWKLRQTWN